MKYLKKFFEHKISIFDQDWKKLLPKQIHIITHNGNFTLVNPQLRINSPLYQITYYDGESNGQPDFLSFDIHTMKDNDGNVANSDKMKLIVNVTYGLVTVSEFSIEYNKVKVIHYTGKDSKHDSESFFGFNDETLADLIKFFNTFGFNLDTTNFEFIDNENGDFSKKD